MRAFVDFFRENPIFMKHVRARLRPNLIGAPVVIVLVLSALAFWVAVRFSHDNDAIVCFHLVIMAQGFILLIVGTTQAGSAVVEAKNSGMLDAHRISPLHPLRIALGFLLGGPIREYLLFALTVPVGFAIAGVFGAPMGPFLAHELITIVNAMFFHSLAVASALMARKGSYLGTGAVIVTYLFSSGMAKWSGPAFLTASPTYLDLFEESGNLARAIAGRLFGFPTRAFYGIALPTFLLCLIFQLPFLILLLVGTVRRLRSERAHLFSRPQALLVLGIIAFLGVGSLWRSPVFPSPQDWPIVPMLFVTYFTSLFAMFLLPIVSATAGEFAQGIRRANKHGKSRPSIWSDWASNFWIAPLMGLIVLVAGTVLTWSPSPVINPRTGFQFQSMSLPAQDGLLWASRFLAALTVTHYGWAFQYFCLRFPTARNGLFIVYLFLFWVLPMVLAGVFWGLLNANEAGTFFWALGPLIGPALIAMPPDLVNLSEFGQAISTLVAIGLAGLFGWLLWNAQRRLFAAHMRAAEVKDQAMEPAKV